jgi:CheY-like chemotaxis protein
MDGLTALRHIRQEEADKTLGLNLVIALSTYRQAPGRLWRWSGNVLMVSGQCAARADR